MNPYTQRPSINSAVHEYRDQPNRELVLFDVCEAVTFIHIASSADLRLYESNTTLFRDQPRYAQQRVLTHLHRSMDDDTLSE